LSYAVKEIYYTLQGEGYHTGRPAVLLRFAGCNLWTGREEDRATAICRFCDTDFVGVDGPGGGRFERPEDLAAAVRDQWPRSEDPGTTPFAVMTGGEPLLQLNAALITALHREGFEIAVETNGTIEAPEVIDWLCVSPKAGTDLVQTSGDELKLVYPQEGAAPERYEHLDFRFYFLQPRDGPHVERHTEFAIEYCVAHPKWRLSLQTHKLLGMP
jgi:7-carboxy-7-deazaguanine synthase (Cx14CxxC type)